ncbi:MAG: hypothetical protein KKH61_21100 [Gammaproteobacteria bacterium]|nr:hypothetical protein [Gammaproteobacteria bacterium]
MKYLLVILILLASMLSGCGGSKAYEPTQKVGKFIFDYLPSDRVWDYFFIGHPGFYIERNPTPEQIETVCSACHEIE